MGGQIFFPSQASSKTLIFPCVIWSKTVITGSRIGLWNILSQGCSGCVWGPWSEVSAPPPAHCPLFLGLGSEIVQAEPIPDREASKTPLAPKGSVCLRVGIIALELGSLTLNSSLKAFLTLILAFVLDMFKEVHAWNMGFCN